MFIAVNRLKSREQGRSKQSDLRVKAGIGRKSQAVINRIDPANQPLRLAAIPAPD
jgi:hypothetical protein